MVRKQGAKKGGFPRRSPWAVALLVLQAAVVAVPVAVVCLWAFAASWPWPDLLPTDWSLKGVEPLVSGSLGMGLPMIGFSVLVAFAASVVATVCGAMAARAVVLHRWRGSSLFHVGTMLPFLIPATVFAMGVQVAFIRVGLAYTAAGVVLACAVVSLPYACSIMVDVTRAAGTGLEDAARVCGAPWWEVLRHVTLPQLAPGLVSSLSMGFVVSFSQYFLTLLVGGGRVRTYALIMFPYLSGADRTVAGAYGLGFMVVTFAVFWLFETLLRRIAPSGDGAYYGS